MRGQVGGGQIADSSYRRELSENSPYFFVPAIGGMSR